MGMKYLFTGDDKGSYKVIPFTVLIEANQFLICIIEAFNRFLHRANYFQEWLKMLEIGVLSAIYLPYHI